MAVELPNKRGRPSGKKQKGTSNNSGVNKHRGEIDKVCKAAAMIATKENQMVMVLDRGQKIRWVRADIWYAQNGHGKPG